MSDLISRKAILKHIEEIRQGALVMDDTRRTAIIMNGMQLCEEAVRNQPSTQLDTCEGCKLISRKAAIGDSEVKCLSCGHHIAERPFEVYCNIMCKWVNEKDYCTMFESAHTMEEFMYGQDLGSPEDGSL